MDFGKFLQKQLRDFDVSGVEAASVTYPDFVRDFQKIGAAFTVA